MRRIENSAERAGRRGEPFAEVAWIRDELGVADELGVEDELAA